MTVIVSLFRKILGITCLVILLLPAASHAFEIAPNGTVVQSTCNGGSLPVCGIPIPMPPTTSVGNTAEVHVPPALLGDTSKIVSFTVSCVDNGYGGGAYQLVNPTGISCGAFPCQASTVRICDTNIPVAGGTPQGGIVHMTMPAPFSPEAFTVQCVGSAGAAPVYQITDHSVVTCNHAAH